MAPQVETEDFAEHDCFVDHHQKRVPIHNDVISEGIESPNLLQKFHLGRKDRKLIPSRNKWMALIFGQFIALVATSMNSSSYVLEYGMHRVFPMFLLFNSYVVLALHLFLNVKKSQEASPLPKSKSAIENHDATLCYRLPLTSLKLRTPWYYYLCLSLLDIVPNYLTLLAMNKTSFTSATLLGSLTIPSTMIFCRILLGKEYRRMHYVGVILCITGGFVTVFTDKVSITTSDGQTSHPRSYAGDVLAILASLGYGVGDACAEYWAKHVDRAEYLGMIGLFGAISTFIISLMYERNALFELFTSDNETVVETVGVILWYIASLVAYYVFASLFLTKSDATILNLSMQTSNIWAIFFSVVVFREAPDLHFYVSILMVISGVFVYELYGNQETERLDQADAHIVNESSLLIDQNRTHRPPHKMVTIA